MSEQEKYENLNDLFKKLKKVGNLKNLILSLIGFDNNLRSEAIEDFSLMKKENLDLIDDNKKYKIKVEELDSYKSENISKSQEILDLKNQINKKENEEKTKLTELSNQGKLFEKSHQGLNDLIEKTEQKLEAERKLQYRKLERSFIDHESHVIKTLSDICKNRGIKYKVKKDTKAKGEPELTVGIGDMELLFDAKSPKISVEIFDNENIEQREKDLSDKIKKSVETAAAGMEKYAQNGTFSTLYLVAPIEVFSYLHNFNFPFKKAKGEVQVISVQQFTAIIEVYHILDSIEEFKEFDPEKRKNLFWLLAQYRHQGNIQSMLNVVMGENNLRLNQKTNEVLSKEELEELALEEKNAFVSIPNDSQKKLIDEKELGELQNKLKGFGVEKGLFDVNLKEEKK